MDSQKTNPFLNPSAAILIAGAMVAIAIIYSMNKNSTNNPLVAAAPAPAAQQQPAAQNAPQQAPASSGVSVAPVTAADHIFGNPNAKVKIIEYTDPSCPYCKLFFPTMTKIMQKYGASGDVAWIYRSYPLSNIHPNAEHESEALECAADIGGNTAFWALANKMYNEPIVQGGLDQTKIPVFAKAVGIDSAKFNACLASGKFQAKIQAIVADGNKAGIDGTPTSFIMTSEGYATTISGAQPYDSVKSTIDKILGAIK